MSYKIVGEVPAGKGWRVVIGDGEVLPVAMWLRLRDVHADPEDPHVELADRIVPGVWNPVEGAVVPPWGDPFDSDPGGWRVAGPGEWVRAEAGADEPDDEPGGYNP